MWSGTTSGPGGSEIFCRESTDGGSSWTGKRQLTWNSNGAVFACLAPRPSIRLHLAWQGYNSGNGEIYYKKSTNGGTTWTASQRLTWNSGSSGYPSMGLSSSTRLHIVWDDDTPGDYEVYYRASTDGGATWGTGRRISLTSGDSYYPVLAVDPSDNLHVVWEDLTAGNIEIYYKMSPDTGASWAASRRITWTSGNSNNPALAADPSGDLHVVWIDNTPGDYEVYYKSSTDGGAGWTASRRLTWNSGSSEDPDIAVDSSSNLHVVWSDKTPGNYEVYYMKFVK